MKYLFHWGSHIPILLRLLEHTTEDVLELGMGIYSTPLLHWYCIEHERKLVSIENNLDYFRMFEKERNPLHKRFLFDNLMDVDLNRPWDIVFIDTGPGGSERKKLAMKVANNAKFIALHDSESSGDKFYRYHEIIPLFKYSINCTKFMPNTLVLSNFISLEVLYDYR
jgi:hypothetical protein